MTAICLPYVENRPLSEIVGGGKINIDRYDRLTPSKHGDCWRNDPTTPGKAYYERGPRCVFLPLHGFYHHMCQDKKVLWICNTCVLKNTAIDSWIQAAEGRGTIKVSLFMAWRVCSKVNGSLIKADGNFFPTRDRWTINRAHSLETYRGQPRSP